MAAEEKPSWCDRCKALWSKYWHKCQWCGHGEHSAEANPIKKKEKPES